MTSSQRHRDRLTTARAILAAEPEITPAALARRLAALDPAFGTLATYFVASRIGPKDAAGWFKHAGAL